MYQVKVACFLNSPYLGGAERSFILQVQSLVKLKSCDVDFVVPYLNHQSEAKVLIKDIKDKKFSDDSINTFKFNKSLFSVSRTWPIFKIFSVVLGFISTLISLNKYSYSRHEIWWVNGNKIGFVCFLLAFLTGFKGKFIWHFRDYPATSKKWHLVWLPLKLPKRFHLQLIGNSHSVSKALSNLNVSSDVKTLYNPVDDSSLDNDHLSRSSNVLGVVSMMAPWKGLHEVILFIALYEKELLTLGFSCVHFYGGDLYKTEGEHSHYFSQIQELKNKLGIRIIEFKGLCPPENIYSEIDFLLHSSTRPEPFGRVILEAMSNNIPVISSGLGGARELIEDRVSGVFYDVKNDSSLLDALTYAYENKSSLINSGKQRYSLIKQRFSEQLALAFEY